MRRAVILFLVTGLTGGCVMIPAYQRPDAPVQADWPEGPAYPSAKERVEERPVATIGWREFFEDNARLIRLIECSLKQNRELRNAILDVQRVRAQYRIQGAELFPEVNIDSGYRNQQTPTTVFGGTPQSVVIETYDLNVGITSYELDLFGRVRSLKKQALQEYLSTFEAQRAAQISLISEVARTYLTLVADRALLKRAEETIRNRRESLKLTRRRFKAGVGSEQAVHQAQAVLESAKADRARFQRHVAQDINALRLAVGGSLPPAFDRGRTLSALPLELPLPAELDSQLLLRRPDVLQQERQLRAANANIGAARAAFFPRVALTGSYGRLSSELSGLFEGGLTGSVAETWNFAPQITVPIFDGGRRQAQLSAAKIRKRQEIATYERTIQEAFREVADALAARGTLEQELTAQADRVQAARASYRIARKRYQQGIDSYLAVLDAQRTLLDARQGLINARRARLTNQVDLYRALGGGWREHTASARDRKTQAQID